MFLIEALRSNTLDTKRTVAAPKEATPRTVTHIPHPQLSQGWLGLMEVDKYCQS
jgi:hypothetical protein